MVTEEAAVGLGSRVMSRVPVGVLVPAVAWQYRFFEPELARLDDFVPRGRGAVDVGVWWGPWTWWLARRVPKVDSFEANLDLVARLEPVLPANVTIHPVALSDHDGEADFWVPPGGAGTEGRGSLEGPGTSGDGWIQRAATPARLDDFELGDVGFLKIDVEGHELPVLRGATKLIDSQRPNVLVEIELRPDRPAPIDEIIELFADHSYKGEFLHRGAWHPIGELDRPSTEAIAAEVARHGYVSNLILNSRRYIHNFVFKPYCARAPRGRYRFAACPAALTGSSTCAPPRRRVYARPRPSPPTTLSSGRPRPLGRRGRRRPAAARRGPAPVRVARPVRPRAARSVWRRSPPAGRRGPPRRRGP